MKEAANEDDNSGVPKLTFLPPILILIQLGIPKLISFLIYGYILIFIRNSKID